MDISDTRPGLLDAECKTGAFAEPDPDKTIGWHLHTETVWGPVTAVPSIGGALTGNVMWYQERRCVKCGRVRRRKVLLEVDVP